MKILLCSYRYAPSVGGIETVSRLLAIEFAAAGHEVRTVTQTAATMADSKRVYRRPVLREFFQEVRWAEVVFHNNVSLRYAWPLLFVQKPWVVAHHTWLRRPNGARGLADRVKERWIRRAENISISTAIAKSLPVSSRVIPDPYDASVFHMRRDIERNGELIFVGRLVSDKGVDVLLNALKLLQAQGIRPKLTIVGDGPERPLLEQFVAEKNLAAQVRFLGQRQGRELNHLLHQHRVLVVPSRWEEPFGIVALEGIACGCAVIGTQGGGLPSAVGPCGVTVPNGDANSLAQAIAAMLADEGARRACLVRAEQHLKLHHPANVAEKYLAVFEEAMI